MVRNNRTRRKKSPVANPRRRCRTSGTHPRYHSQRRRNKARGGEQFEAKSGKIYTYIEQINPPVIGVASITKQQGTNEYCLWLPDDDDTCSANIEDLIEKYDAEAADKAAAAKAAAAAAKAAADKAAAAKAAADKAAAAKAAADDRWNATGYLRARGWPEEEL